MIDVFQLKKIKDKVVNHNNYGQNILKSLMKEYQQVILKIREQQSLLNQYKGILNSILVIHKRQN